MTSEADFKKILLDRRRQLMEDRDQAEAVWDRSHETEIEFEETAAKAQRAREFDILQEREYAEIGAIDRALGKIDSGGFGECENCGAPIGEKRLEAIPWTTLCIECASLPPEQRAVENPDEFESETGSPANELTDQEIKDMIEDELRQDGTVEIQDLVVTSENGVIRLDGVLPSPTEHEFLIRIVQDVLGFHDYTDNILIDRVAWERRDRTPGRRARHEPDKEIMMGGEETDENVYRSRRDGTPVSPPDKFVPEQDR